jgi:hypothetical protein
VPFEIGDEVIILNDERWVGRYGTVVELDGDEVVVDVGARRLVYFREWELGVTELELASRPLRTPLGPNRPGGTLVAGEASEGHTGELSGS